MVSESFIYSIAVAIVFISLGILLKNKIKKITDDGIYEVEDQILNSKKDKLDALNILETLDKEKNILILEEAVEITKYKQELNDNTEKEKEKISINMEKELSAAKNKISKLKANKLNEIKSFMISAFLDSAKKDYKFENNKFTISSIDGIEKVFIDKTKE